MSGNGDRLLAAVMDSLCSLQLRLRTALPNLCDLQETLYSRNSYQSPDMEKISSISSPSENGSTSPILPQMDSHQYPVLVKHMVLYICIYVSIQPAGWPFFFFI